MGEIKSFPILYKRNNTNKVSQWHITIEKEDDKYNLISEFGLVGGKLQTQTTIIDKGKANRTVLEQSILEAESKYNTKTNRDTYSEVLPDTEIVRPMLAKTYKLYDKIYFPIYVQRKFDGIRCMSHFDTKGDVILESRKGMKFENFDKINIELNNLYANMLKSNIHILYQKNIFFDGELFTNDFNFETISGIVRLKSANLSKEKMEMKNKIKYYIYDIYDTKNPSWIYKDRMSFLLDLAKNNNNEIIEFVCTDTALNSDDIITFHEKYVDEGFEGIMIRQSDGVYEQNKRSKYLQKYKNFMEEEFEIVGFHDGDGHDKEMVIWDCITSTGKGFSAKPNGSFDERRRIYKIASSFIGKKLTVIFQEYSADMIPRFPVAKEIRDYE